MLLNNMNRAVCFNVKVTCCFRLHPSCYTFTSGNALFKTGTCFYIFYLSNVAGSSEIVGLLSIKLSSTN